MSFLSCAPIFSFSDVDVTSVKTSLNMHFFFFYQMNTTLLNDDSYASQIWREFPALVVLLAFMLLRLLLLRRVGLQRAGLLVDSVAGPLATSTAPMSSR